MLAYFNEFQKTNPSVKVYVSTISLSEKDMLLVVTFKDLKSDKMLQKKIPEKKIGSSGQFIEVLNEMVLEWITKDMKGWE